MCIRDSHDLFCHGPYGRVGANGFDLPERLGVLLPGIHGHAQCKRGNGLHVCMASRWSYAHRCHGLHVHGDPTGQLYGGGHEQWLLEHIERDGGDHGGRSAGEHHGIRVNDVLHRWQRYAERQHGDGELLLMVEQRHARERCDGQQLCRNNGRQLLGDREQWRLLDDLVERERWGVCIPDRDDHGGWIDGPLLRWKRGIEREHGHGSHLRMAQ